MPLAQNNMSMSGETPPFWHFKRFTSTLSCPDRVFCSSPPNSGSVRQIAYLLRATWGLKKGDRVIMAFNFGLRFFDVFLGCLRAGVVAVPVYPPNPATLKWSRKKLDHIVQSCDPKMVLLGPLFNKLRLASKLKALTSASSGWPGLPCKCPNVKEGVDMGGAGVAESKSSSFFGGRRPGRSPDALRDSFDEPSITDDDVAFLQFIHVGKHV